MGPQAQYDKSSCCPAKLALLCLVAGCSTSWATGQSRGRRLWRSCELPPRSGFPHFPFLISISLSLKPTLCCSGVASETQKAFFLLLSHQNLQIVQEEVIGSWGTELKMQIPETLIKSGALGIVKAPLGLPRLIATGKRRNVGGL